MKIQVDGCVDMIALDGESTLADLLPAVEELLKKNGREVVKIELDGSPLLERDASQEKISLKQDGILNVSTAKNEMLPFQLLRGMESYVKELLEKIPQVVRSLNACRRSEAFPFLIKCVDRLNWITVSHMRLGRLMKVDYAASLVDEVSLEDFMASFSEHLEEAKEAFQNDDLTMLADTLEFQLLPDLRTYQKAILGLREVSWGAAH